MAEIRPIRAIRYDVDAIGRDAIADVVTPPYDVIDAEQQEGFYRSHPHNFIRIDLNRERPDDGPENDRYTRARRHLFDWLADGVLTIDDEPSLYVHHQTFADAAGAIVTRRGFLGAIRLAGYDEKVVLPHERTLRGPKEDRLRLMKATECQLSPVFFLYGDEQSAVDEALGDAISGSEPLRIETPDGIVHELWRITHPETVAFVQEFLAEQSVLIADGHHRYETALAYRDFRRSVAESPDADAPYEFTLGFFVNRDDPGLAVFPTHRVVHSVSDYPGIESITARLSAHDDFTVERLDGDRETVQAALVEAGASHPGFVLLGEGRQVLVRFVGDTGSELFDDDTPVEVRALDVAVLHEALLDGILGISREAQEAKTNLDYVKGFDAAWSAAEDSASQLVVLMNATPVHQVDRVCRSGGVMPQKSTYFYPKILSGLLINPL